MSEDCDEVDDSDDDGEIDDSQQALAESQIHQMKTTFFNRTLIAAVHSP
jgi:hypothetical protein